MSSLRGPVDQHDLEKITARDDRLGLGWEGRYRVEFSVPVKPEELEAAYGKGMLRKEQLSDGVYYWGICRNARVARWSAKHQMFFHQRKKVRTWRVESIPHPTDEKTTKMFGRIVGFDVFLPWVEVEPLPRNCRSD